MDTRRTLRRRLADLSRRYAEAVAERDDAIRAAEADRFNLKRVAGQLDEAREERAAAERKPTAELRDTRRALMISERARQSLDEQLAHLQAANEAMARDLVAGCPTWEVTAP